MKTEVSKEPPDHEMYEQKRCASYVNASFERLIIFLYHVDNPEKYFDKQGTR